MIIRQKDKASGGITAEENVLMVEHAKLWIARIMRTDPIEPSKIVPAIEGLYAAAGLKKPRVIVVPSPLVMAFAYGASAAILESRHKKGTAKRRTAEATSQATDEATDQATNRATHRATDQATDQATYRATDLATYRATHRATNRATVLATDHATDQATRQATYNVTSQATNRATILATDEVVRGAVLARRSLGGKRAIELAKKWADVYQGGNMWGQHDCYLTAMRDIIGLKLDAHEKYKFWEDAAIHGGFRVMHPEFCLVSDFPEILKVDDQNRPHCADGPSHRWRDGWSLYHWHGLRVPDEWITDKKSLSASVALKQKNAELRRSACEILGWNAILQELNATVIDADADPEIGTLVEVDIPNIGRERFLRVRCGTGREFAVPMPPHIKTALEGNSWSYDIPPDLLKQKEFRT